MEKDDTLAAGVAEVSLDRSTGKIKVHNIWAAIDAGIAVQPRNLAAQTEGSIVFGLGHVLREKITIKDGRVQESNFNDYQVPRMSDMPNIEVQGDLHRQSADRGGRGRTSAGRWCNRQCGRGTDRCASAGTAVCAGPCARCPWSVGSFCVASDRFQMTRETLRVS